MESAPQSRTAYSFSSGKYATPSATAGAIPPELDSWAVRPLDVSIGRGATHRPSESGGVDVLAGDDGRPRRRRLARVLAFTGLEVVRGRTPERAHVNATVRDRERAFRFPLKEARTTSSTTVTEPVTFVPS